MCCSAHHHLLSHPYASAHRLIHTHLPAIVHQRARLPRPLSSSLTKKLLARKNAFQQPSSSQHVPPPPQRPFRSLKAKAKPSVNPALRRVLDTILTHGAIHSTERPWSSGPVETKPPKLRKHKKKRVKPPPFPSPYEPIPGFEEGGWANVLDEHLSQEPNARPSPEKPPLGDSHRNSFLANRLRGPPPHNRPPIPYTRRVEGLLNTSPEPLLKDLVPPSGAGRIATLSHGLERVLFNPGVHWLQDPRSHVYNFTPILESIPSVREFAFERTAGFIKSSRDEDLRTLAKREGRTFAGSTSSVSGLLCQLYFLISEQREVSTEVLGRYFQNESKKFTPGQRKPVSVTMNYKEGVYAIDSDSSAPGEAEKNVLTWLGQLLERYLTTSPESFQSFLRSFPPGEASAEQSRAEPQAYRYSKSDRFVLRSQLDCVDPRLPGTGVFDIKTRATLPIRLDLLNWEENAGYLIKTLHGPLESFEREYYDLIRSAFLKYSFQVRIGNMDGVFVAYHNTQRMFGFQYISAAEMDERLFGRWGSGEKVFEKCLRLLEAVLEEVTLCFPGQSLKCTFDTPESADKMRVFVQPMEWDESEQGPRPIRRLDVFAKNYIAGQEMRGPRAVGTSADDVQWTVHWTVCTSSDDPEDTLRLLDACKARQLHAYNLPHGVAPEGMEEYWRTQLDFSGRQGEAGAEGEAVAEGAEGKAGYDPKKFRRPGWSVLRLRELARQGKKEAERREEESKGRQKVVFLPGEVEVGMLPEKEMKQGEPKVDLAQSGASVVDSGKALPEVNVASTQPQALPLPPGLSKRRRLRRKAELLALEASAQSSLVRQVVATEVPSDEHGHGGHAKDSSVMQEPEIEGATYPLEALTSGESHAASDVVSHDPCSEPSVGNADLTRVRPDANERAASKVPPSEIEVSRKAAADNPIVPSPLDVLDILIAEMAETTEAQTCKDPLPGFEGTALAEDIQDLPLEPSILKERVSSPSDLADLSVQKTHLTGVSFAEASGQAAPGLPPCRIENEGMDTLPSDPSLWPQLVAGTTETADLSLSSIKSNALADAIPDSSPIQLKRKSPSASALASDKPNAGSDVVAPPVHGSCSVQPNANGRIPGVTIGSEGSVDDVPSSGTEAQEYVADEVVSGAKGEPEASTPPSLSEGDASLANKKG